MPNTSFRRPGASAGAPASRPAAAPARTAAAPAPARTAPTTRRAAAPTPAPQPEPEIQGEIEQSVPAPVRRAARAAAPAPVAPAAAPAARRATPAPAPAPEEPVAVEPEGYTPEEAAPVREAAAPHRAAAPQPSSEDTTAPAEATLAFPVEDVSGEIGRGDVVIPNLKIVQSVGPLSEIFTPGQIVITSGGENNVVLTDGEVPIELVVCRVRKQYIENTEYGSDVRPRVFDTENQVLQAGGWTDWRNNEAPPFSPICIALVAVAQPEGIDEGFFPYLHEESGIRFALALWTMKSTAYTRAAKLIFTQVIQPSWARNPRHASWQLNTVRAVAGRNTISAPVLRLAPATQNLSAIAGVREYLESITR